LSDSNCSRLNLGSSQSETLYDTQGAMLSMDVAYVLHHKQQDAEAAVCNMQRLRSKCCCK